MTTAEIQDRIATLDQADVRSISTQLRLRLAAADFTAAKPTGDEILDAEMLCAAAVARGISLHGLLPGAPVPQPAPRVQPTAGHPAPTKPAAPPTASRTPPGAPSEDRESRIRGAADPRRELLDAEKVEGAERAGATVRRVGADGGVILASLPTGRAVFGNSTPAGPTPTTGLAAEFQGISDPDARARFYAKHADELRRLATAG